MTRPCLCDNVELGKPYDASKHCRHCWNYHHSPTFRKAWGGPPLLDKQYDGLIQQMQSQGISVQIGVKMPEPVPVEEGPGWFKELVEQAKEEITAKQEVQKPEESKGPSLFKKAINFGGALVKHAWHGMPQSAPEEQKRRVSLCLACEHLMPSNGTCGKCGCVCAWKASWSDQKCPVGKW